MRLVLQCIVCGTIHTVGTAICGTCRASGIQNLRLLFECQNCFRLGLDASCDSCSRLLSLDPVEKLPEPRLPVISISSWEIVSEEELKEAVLEDVSVEDLRGGRMDDTLAETSAFDLSLDDLPVAEPDEDEMRLENKPDSIVKDE